MIGYVFSSSLREFAQWRRMGVWLVILALITVLLAVWVRLRGEPGSAETFVRSSEHLIFRLLAFVSAILSSAILAGEVEQRTIVYLLTRPVPRWQLLIGRYLACSLVVAFLLTLMLAANAWLQLGNPFHSYFLRGVPAVFLGAFAYGAVYLLISLVSQRAVLFGLAYAFGWETLIASMPGQVFYLSIHNHMLGVANYPRPSMRAGGIRDTVQNAFGDAWVAQPVGVATLLGIAVIGGIIGALWFSTHEYVGREDAE